MAVLGVGRKGERSRVGGHVNERGCRIMTRKIRIPQFFLATVLFQNVLNTVTLFPRVHEDSNFYECVN